MAPITARALADRTSCSRALAGYMGLQGVTRVREPRTTRADPRQAAPADHVRGDFKAGAPDQLWDCEFYLHATWAGLSTSPS